MTRNGARRSGRRLLDWKALLGIGLSLALLYYAFRGVDLGEVAARAREADPWLLLLAALAATAVFPLRALRWRPLLRPVHPGSRFQPRFAATCIGFMANNLLPARVGEFARAYALSRLEPVRASASFGSLVVERIFDGITVVTLLLIALAWPTFPDFSGPDLDAPQLLPAADRELHGRRRDHALVKGAPRRRRATALRSRADPRGRRLERAAHEDGGAPAPHSRLDQVARRHHDRRPADVEILVPGGRNPRHRPQSAQDQ